MPTIQTPKTYLHKIFHEIIKNNSLEISQKKSQNVLQIQIYFLSL